MDGALFSACFQLPIPEGRCEDLGFNLKAPPSGSE